MFAAKSSLPAHGEARDQGAGKACLAHLLLCLFYRVGGTAELPGQVFRVQKGVGGAWIVVARLAHAAGIDEAGPAAAPHERCMRVAADHQHTIAQASFT